ncbi:hypothetical protein L9F63_021590, partial [Diploptera punctata]
MTTKEWLSARKVLWLLILFGTGYNYMTRLNINIAIVSMVKIRTTSKIQGVSSQCTSELQTTSNCTTDISNSTHSISQGTFDWDEYQQGMILGAYYWTYWALQIPGGYLSQKYGTKLAFGMSNLGLCICGFFIPFAAKIDYRMVVALRAIQGIIGAVAWPSLHTIVGMWIPPNERSRFITSYLGSSIGAAIIYPVCGLIINWFDWQMVFYVTTVIGIIWFTFWWLCVFDSPDEHPRISPEEFSHIKKGLGKTVIKKKPPTPWKSILLSVPMWVNVITQWGAMCGFLTLVTQAPTYFKFVHGMDIRAAGVSSGIPYAIRIIFALLVSAGCDYMLLYDKMSLTNVRKLAIAICCLLQAGVIICLAFFGFNHISAVILVTLATASSGAQPAGALGNLLDLSPNYASLMLGIAQTVSSIPGVISPVIVSYFTFQNCSTVLVTISTVYCRGPLQHLFEVNGNAREAKRLKIGRKQLLEDWISSRDVLWLLVLLGTGYNYMIRLNINIAIVSMVKNYDTSEIQGISSECFEAQTITNFTDHDSSSTDMSSQERYDWDEYQQGMILGAFYWTYWAGQIPGGYLSQKYGTKVIFGMSNLGLCIFGFFIPLAARIDYRLLVALRTMQGFVGGLAWPSLHTLVGLWIPPNERSRFITSYMGSSVGAVIIYPVCGLIINWFSWQMAFYFTSTVGIIWFISWWIWVYDSPDEHPRISAEEYSYIKDSLGKAVIKKKPPTPWKSILLSFPMWINIISQWGNLWGLFTLITQAPTYFKFIHGMDIRTVDILFSVNPLFGCVNHLCFSFNFFNHTEGLILFKLLSGVLEACIVDVYSGFDDLDMVISRTISSLPPP